MPTKQQDEIIIALHENDYDVGRTIEFLLEGGDVTQDWVTAGNRGKSSKQSPNQTANDEAELSGFVATSNGRSKSHKGKGGDSAGYGGHSNGGQTNGRGGGERGSARSRENRPNGSGRNGALPRGDRPPRRNNEFNDNDLDDKMIQLDLNNERPHKSNSGADLNQDESSYRGGNGKRGNGTGPSARGVRSGPGRGGSNGVRANGRGGRNGGK